MKATVEEGMEDMGMSDAECATLAAATTCSIFKY